VAPDSLENRTAWARELGRCDAFDDVLAIWEAGDRDLVPVRARRERELAHAIARARTRTAKSALLGVLALLALAVPIAAFATRAERRTSKRRSEQFRQHWSPCSTTTLRASHGKLCR
jgi:hypothetical protein